MSTKEVKRLQRAQTNKKNDDTFENMFGMISRLTADPRYSRIPTDRVISAFGMAWGNNPNIKHTRLLRTRSQPYLFDRGSLEGMIKDPLNNEQSLRQAAAAFDYSSYPLYKLKKTLTDTLTYRWTYLARYIELEDAKKDEFLRERKLVDKFCKALNPQVEARLITQNALSEGKVFKYMRYDIDKSHNKVNAVALMDLASDYCKIVSRNSCSYYTVAFNFTYFWQAGTDIDQFPPIFRRYYNLLNNLTERSGETLFNKNKKVINMKKAAEIMGQNKEIRAGKIKGNYFMWVELPVDECFVFGTDFSSPIQAPMLMGLFLSAQDLSSYEYLQPQLLQMPLYGMLTGEIPYHDEKDGTKKDNYTKLSPTGYEYYRSLFYEMMASNDTKGIDMFFAPVENMKLQSLQEVPNSGKIITTAYQDFLTKAGITGIQSSTDKPMASMVSTSQKIESRYADLIYWQFSNMMNQTLNYKLNLQFCWEFEMFGSIFTDEKAFAAAEKAVTLGQTQFVHYYLALNPAYPMTLEDALSGAKEVRGSGLYELYMPLVNSYTISDKDPGRVDMPIGEIESEETEASIDKGNGDGL